MLQDLMGQAIVCASASAGDSGKNDYSNVETSKILMQFAAPQAF